MEGSERLSEAVELASTKNEIDNKHWEGVRKQYETLDELLETLTDKRVHKCMVPISNVAFCPGKLVHTNDITVLLGDNYFADVSAKTGRKIIKHRIELVTSRIEKGKVASELVNQRKDELEKLEEDLIKEEITEEDEIMCEQTGRVSRMDEKSDIMKEIQEKLKRTKIKSDDEIWKEIQRKEGKVQNKPTQKYDTIIKKITEEQIKPTVEIIEEIAEENFDENKHVHFQEEILSDDSEIEQPLEIKFRFSNNNPKPVFSNDSSVQTPWDIQNNYIQQKHKKSILKQNSEITSIPKTGQSGSIVQPTERNIPKIAPKRTQTAFTETIIEHKTPANALPAEIPKKKISLFKQRRLKN